MTFQLQLQLKTVLCVNSLLMLIFDIRNGLQTYTEF